MNGEKAKRLSMRRKMNGYYARSNAFMMKNADVTAPLEFMLN
jgi:hypothetical protein